jgi:hypothetical protein
MSNTTSTDSIQETSFENEYFTITVFAVPTAGRSELSLSTQAQPSLPSLPQSSAEQRQELQIRDQGAGDTKIMMALTSFIVRFPSQTKSGLHIRAKVLNSSCISASSAAIFQLLGGRDQNHTWSIRGRQHVGSARTRPCLGFRFVDEIGFDLRHNSDPPSRNAILYKLVSRKQDRNRLHPMTANEALVKHRNSFPVRVRVQFCDRSDIEFLRSSVNKVSHDLWLDFPRWENGPDAVFHRRVTGEKQKAKWQQQKDALAGNPV